MTTDDRTALVTTQGLDHRMTEVVADPTSAFAVSQRSVFVPVGSLVVNVRDYGAKGNGSTDDTAAIQAALTALPANGTLFFPAGNYLCGSALTVPSYVTMLGTGKASRLTYTGSATFIPLVSKREVKWRDLYFNATGTTAVLFSLDNTFRCSWRGCYLAGGFSGPANSGSFLAQTGILLTNNAGDNIFLDGDIANFGIGINTQSIQNGIEGSKLGTNNIHINATGNGGMSIAGYTVMVSAPGSTDTAIKIDGATGQWWLSGLWIEGCTTAITVGNKVGSTYSGPSQFSMVGCKVSASATGINMVAAQYPVIMGVQIAGDSAGSATPAPITVDATGAPQGVLMADSTVTGQPIVETTFPIAWLVNARGGNTAGFKVPTNFRFPFGAALTMARSDNAYIQALQMVGGPTLQIKGATSNSQAIVRVQDTSALTVLELDSVTAAVNYPYLRHATTGNPAVFGARGTDTNVDVQLLPKGAGGVKIGTGGRQFSGSGAPILSATSGDYYFRTDTPTVANQRIYVCTGTTNWTPLI